MKEGMRREGERKFRRRAREKKENFYVSLKKKRVLFFCEFFYCFFLLLFLWFFLAYLRFDMYIFDHFVYFYGFLFVFSLEKDLFVTALMRLLSAESFCGFWYCPLVFCTTKTIVSNLLQHISKK